MLFVFYVLYLILNFFVLKYINISNKLYIKFFDHYFDDDLGYDDLSFSEKIILALLEKNLFFINSISFYKNYDSIMFSKNNFSKLNSFKFFNFNTDHDLYSVFTLKKNFNFFKKKLKFFKKKFINFCKFNYFLNLIFRDVLIKHIFKDSFKTNIYLEFLSCYLLNKKIKPEYYLNLNMYDVWYNFVFNKKTNNLKDRKTIMHKIFDGYLLKLNEKHEYINIKTIKFFKKICKQKKFFEFSFFLTNFFKYKFNLNKIVFFKKITLSKKIKNNLYKYPTRFSETSVNKNINDYNINNYIFLFLRKNKIFNKSRYSRNRQLYRTGVYWCLWLNIIIVYGLYFSFYRFVFNFGYIWYFIFILVFSTIFSRIIKYKFYNLYILFTEFFNLFNWFGFLLNNLHYNYNNIIFNKNTIITEYFLFEKFFKININVYVIKFLIKKSKKLDFGFLAFWKTFKQAYGYDDNSFLKWRSIIHWLGEYYKALKYKS